MTAERPKIDYAPGLDGIRGLCLIGVLLFHSPFAWMGGGFLGVSTFFTLSGYLITTLLLAEIERDGAVDFASFWERRMRRLGPPLWLGVVATVLSAPAWIPEESQERLAADAVASLAFVSNWRFMSPEYAYARLFADPSALQHCWSLAIEAQYYLVFPLLLAALAGRWGRRLLSVGVVSLLVASMGTSLWIAATGGANYRIYYGTDTRAAEILVGAVLALVARGRIAAALRARSALVSAVGGLALVAMLACWALTAVESAWLYHGGFALYALVSAVVIFAAIADDHPLRRLLAARVLRQLGKISYGAYVFHWPIFLWLDADRTGLGAGSLLVLRVALTLGLAALSYRYIEVPVRTRALLAGRVSVAVASMGVILVVGLAAIASGGIQAPTQWRAAARQSAADGPRGAGRPLRFSLYGDSTAMNLSGWLQQSIASLGMSLVGGRRDMGCSLIDRGEALTIVGWAPVPPNCRGLGKKWSDDIVKNRPDVGIVLLGSWEVRDRRLPGDSRQRAVGDPVMDEAIQAEMRRAIESFREHHVKVVWINLPRLRFSHAADEEQRAIEAAASDPARMRRFNEILERVAAEYRHDVRLVDFARYLEDRPGGPFDPAIRSDGVHFTRAARPELAKWLADRIVAASREMIPGDSD